MKYVNIIIYGLILTCSTCLMASAQEVDTVYSHFVAIGDFEGAKAINSSPDGSLYVVDEAASTIHQFDPGGMFVRKHGGPGLSEGQFDGPVDIDPTNGLVLVVADAGNGRIQRFSREFLFLESLELTEDSDTYNRSFSDQPRYRQNEQSGASGAGRPISVITSSTNEMYAIDAARQVVLKWDQDRNLTQVIGDYDAGDGALIDPFDLELGSDGSLFVLDRQYNSVFVYDAFGGYLGEIGPGKLVNAVALEHSGEYLLVAFPDKVYVYHERGRLESVFAIKIPEPASDLLFTRGQLYILGPERLYIYKGSLSGVLKPGNLK